MFNFFRLETYTKSMTAIRQNIDNTPTQDQISKLKTLDRKCVSKIRRKYKKKGEFNISSGFRCPKLNTAIGSENPDSDHTKGLAVDFEVFGVDNFKLWSWIRDNLEYKQCLLERYRKGDPSSGWIHLSYDENNLRNESFLYKCHGFDSNLYRKNI